VKRAVLLVVLVACSSNDDVPAPQVAAVTPDQAAAGTVVTVTGSFFCQQADGSDDPLACDNTGEVRFGTASGSIAEYTDSEIMVEVPGGAGSVQVTVAVAGRTSNSVDFTIE